MQADASFDSRPQTTQLNTQVTEVNEHEAISTLVLIDDAKNITNKVLDIEEKVEA